MNRDPIFEQYEHGSSGLLVPKETEHARKVSGSAVKEYKDEACRLLARGADIATNARRKDLHQYLERERQHLEASAARRMDKDGAVAQALRKLEWTMTLLAMPLRTEVSVYASEGGGAAAKLVNEDRLRQLTENAAEWRADLERALQDIREELEDEVDARILDLRETIDDEYLPDDELIRDPQGLRERITTDMTQLLNDLAQKLEDRAANVTADLRAKSGLQFIDFQPARFAEDVSFENADDIGEIEPVRGRKVFRVTRELWARGGAAGGGAVVGAVLGFPLGVPTIGGVLGAGVGHLINARREHKYLKRSDLEQTRALLERQVSQFVPKAQLEIHSAVRKALRDFERRARGELNDELEAELGTILNSRESLRQARERSPEEVSRRRADVESTLAPVEQLLTEASQLAQRGNE